MEREKKIEISSEENSKRKRERMRNSKREIKRKEKSKNDAKRTKVANSGVVKESLEKGKVMIVIKKEQGEKRRERKNEKRG